MSTCIRQIAASHSKLVFSSTFIFCSPIYPTNFGEFFFVKMYFRFREMIFFVRPLKYANFYPEYYPSCVTSCNEFTGSPVFLSTSSFFLSSKLNPLSLLKLAKKHLFFGEYFCLTYFLHVEKKHQNKDSFNNDRYYRIY